MLNVRMARIEDAPLILSFIHELAEYEREPSAVRATENDLIRDDFSTNPKFRVIIAESDGNPAGMAFFFHHYSTWQGKARTFPGRPFRKATLQRQRRRQSSHGSSLTDRYRGELLRNAMGSARLEHDRHRCLSATGSPFPRALASDADHGRRSETPI